MVTTFAGDPNTSGDYADNTDYDDGFGTTAEFDLPRGLVISGTSLYVADTYNNVLRVVDTETKEVTTLAGYAPTGGTTDGTGTNARFKSPWALAISGTELYVLEYGNHAIRVVDTETKDVTTVAGDKGTYGTDDGTGTNARFKSPRGLAISGTSLYVADTGSHAIRVVDTVTKVVTTLAGEKGTYAWKKHELDATGTNARFYKPHGLAISGTKLYVADSENDLLRVVDTGTAVVTTLAGGGLSNTDGIGTNAGFGYPIFLDISCNKLYVSCQASDKIRVVDTDTKEVTTVAGMSSDYPSSTDGTGTNARFSYPNGLAIDPADASTFYVADTDLIRLIKY